MQKSDINQFNWVQMFNNPVTGKTDAGLFCAFFTVVVMCFAFILTLGMCLFSKDVKYVAYFITALSLEAGLIMSSLGYLFGSRSKESNEMMADINKGTPITNINQPEKVIQNP